MQRNEMSAGRENEIMTLILELSVQTYTTTIDTAVLKYIGNTRIYNESRSTETEKSSNLQI